MTSRLSLQSSSLALAVVFMTLVCNPTMVMVSADGHLSGALVQLRLANGSTVMMPLDSVVSELTAESQDATDTSINVLWLLLSGILVFFMQAGFSLLETGSVSHRNHKNILLKNIADAAFGAIWFYFWGYAFALGEDGDGFISWKGFALGSDDFTSADNFPFYNGSAYATWFFQWAFAATATTIVSGAVAERVRFEAYIVYGFFLTSFIYPVVVHWAWSGDGWASSFREDRDDKLFDTGVVDFAGSGVVHMVGGMAALVGAYFVGPRNGRFNADGTVNPLPESSPVHQTLGTFILWFGWYGFNCGSTLALTGGFADVAAKVAVNTTLSAAAAGISSSAFTLILTYARSKKQFLDINSANNGVLGGLVGITAGCSVVDPEGALIIGIISGVVFQLAHRLLLRLRIDDVVSASPVHLFCGAWGVLAAGLFATEKSYAAAYVEYENDPICGAFYGCGGKLFAANLIFVIAVAAWTGILASVLFFVLSRMQFLRVSADVEEQGLDVNEHGGAAYGEIMLVKRGVDDTTSNGAAAAPHQDFAGSSMEGRGATVA